MNTLTKTCKTCKATSDAVEWVLRNGLLSGLRCRQCSREEKKHAQRRYMSDPDNRKKAANSVKMHLSVPANRKRSNAASVKCSLPNRKTNKMAAQAHRIRNLVISGLKRHFLKKSVSTPTMLGCTFEELLRHLDCVDGIPEGYAIDHIIPMAVAYDEASAIRLNHYTNLQLLTDADNLAKSDWYTFPSGECIRARDMTLEQKMLIVEGLKEA